MTEIIKNNERLIYSVINKYIRYFDKDDLYQAGVLGLLSAYKSYRNDKNTKFSSYAYFFIIGEVKKYIRENSNIKIPKEISKLNILIEKTRELLSQKLKKEATDEEVAEFINVPLSSINEVKVCTGIMRSLDEELEDNNLYDYIGYSDSLLTDDYMDLKNEISKLNSFDKAIIENRYLNGRSQKETSDILGVNQVKISREEKQILARLRTRLK